jgi:cholesterol oxidase
MAYRVAETGLNVCVLGGVRVYPTNKSYRSPLRMKTYFGDPSEGLYGTFNHWSFKECKEKDRSIVLLLTCS